MQQRETKMASTSHDAAGLFEVRRGAVNGEIDAIRATIR
jgi:hypothetical protein